MFAVEHLNAAYTTEPVLQDIGLALKPGETFGLIGLNGAGKTTLIKIILGLRKPNSGRILFNGQELGPRTLHRIKSQMAYLPEKFEPPWFLSGAEFVRFSASLYQRRVNPDEMRLAAESLDLDPKVLDRRVQTYSKGMRQKLGLMATMLTGCELLILDEPMSGLDPKARARVKDSLVTLKAQGRTVFLSSHILADMSEICDRVAVLHDKSIRFDGTPDLMVKEYNASSLERAFLNIIEGGQKNAA